MSGRIQRPEPTDKLALPRVGKVKIGKKNEKGYPMSVDYFIPSGKYAGLFTQAYGDKPNTIQILFPSDDPSQVCNEYYEYRNDSGKLIAYGDGETFHVWNGKAYAPLTTKDYPNVMELVCKKYPRRYPKGLDDWRVRLTLSFMLPMVRGIAGVWVFDTNGSLSTIPNIRDTFDGIKDARGSVYGVLFDLNVQFATSQKPDNNSRYPVVNLIPNESEENVTKVKNALKPIKLLTSNE